MSTTMQYINQLKKDKENLVSMLQGKGVEASNEETFTSLTPKVGTIVTDPILQDKTVEITENGEQTISADAGYDGLNNVTVTTNIATSGELPEAGCVVKKYTEDGYPEEIEVGELPNYALGRNSTPIPMFSSKLKKVSVTSDITSIGNYALANCSSVTTINLPDTCTTIGSYAFTKTDLSETVLPDSIQSIGDYAFSESNFLPTSLPANLQTVNQYGFYKTNLSLDKLPDSLQTLKNYAFSNTKLAIKTLPSSLTTIPVGCFDNIASTEITIPSTVTSVGGYAFRNCPNLEKVNWESTYNTISGNCFANDSKLKEVKVSSTVTSIAYGSFLNCGGLVQISLPSVTKIVGTSNSTATQTSSTGGFTNCSSLKAVWIGGVTSGANIGRYAFYNCSSLIRIFINMPRADVEALTNYTYAFMNNTGKTSIIICNDDEGFMDQATFDSTDWSTVTG